MTTPFKQVKEFHEKFGSYIGTGNETLYNEINVLRFKLVKEEFDEVEKAWLAGDKANLLKELADLEYVILGWYLTLGIDGDKVFSKVHESNMSKLGLDGKPVLREDGKILKGPRYKPVDEDSLVELKIE